MADLKKNKNQEIVLPTQRDSLRIKVREEDDKGMFKIFMIFPLTLSFKSNFSGKGSLLDILFNIFVHFFNYSCYCTMAGYGVKCLKLMF